MSVSVQAELYVVLTNKNGTDLDGILYGVYMAERRRDVRRFVAKEIRKDGGMTYKEALVFFDDYFRIERAKINHIFTR